jgi:hypothetical protein
MKLYEYENGLCEWKGNVNEIDDTDGINQTSFFASLDENHQHPYKIFSSMWPIISMWSISYWMNPISSM